MQEKEIGLKACVNKNKKESESWWKRRIKKAIAEVRKCHQRGEIGWKEKYLEFERNYNMKKTSIRSTDYLSKIREQFINIWMV